MKERISASLAASVESEDNKNRKRKTLKSKMSLALIRHEKLLKRDILRKKALLERDLKFEIQVGYFIVVIIYHN